MHVNKNATSAKERHSRNDETQTFSPFSIQYCGFQTKMMPTMLQALCFLALLAINSLADLPIHCVHEDVCF